MLSKMLVAVRMLSKMLVAVRMLSKMLVAVLMHRKFIKIAAKVTITVLQVQSQKIEREKNKQDGSKQNKLLKTFLHL